MSSLDPNTLYVDHTGKIHNIESINNQLKVTPFASDGVDISINGVIDENNTSHEPLGIDEVFPGTATDVLQASIIFVTVYADQASAIDGLVIEQGHSVNGVESIFWDTEDTYTIPASTGKTFSIQPSMQYMRITYTNGGIAQTEFRLHAVIKKGNALASSHRIEDNISGEDDSRLVKAVITGKGKGGLYRNIELDSEFNGPVVLDPDHHEVHEGNHYFYKNFVDFVGGADETVYFMFITPDTDTRIHAKVSLYANVEFEAYIFRDGTVSVNGTQVTTVNNRGDSPNTAELVAYAGPTVTTDGTQIWASKMGSGKNATGVAPGLNHEIVGDQNTIYLFKLVKKAVQAGYMDVDFWWYEH